MSADLWDKAIFPETIHCESILRPGNAFIHRKTVPGEVVTVRSQRQPGARPGSHRGPIDRVPSRPPAVVLARLATLTAATDACSAALRWLHHKDTSWCSQSTTANAVAATELMLAWRTRKPCYRKDDRAMRPMYTYKLFTLILFTLTVTILCADFDSERI